MGSKETLVLAILCLLFSRVGWTLTNLVLFEPIARGTGGRQPPAGCGAGPAGGRVWTRRGWGWCCFCFLPQRGVGGVAAPRLTLPPRALHLARCGRVFCGRALRGKCLRGGGGEGVLARRGCEGRVAPERCAELCGAAKLPRATERERTNNRRNGAAAFLRPWSGGARC